MVWGGRWEEGTPEVNIQAQLSLGGETGESVPEALRVRQEDPESKPGPSETSLCVRLEEQGTLDQRPDLPEGQTEARASLFLRL